MNISIATNSVLRIAQQESQFACKQNVDAVQIFCGLTKLVELASSGDLRFEELTQEQRQQFLSETEFVNTLFLQAVFDTTRARRQLRKDVGKGDAESSDWEKILPSNNMRAMFDRAEVIAAERGGSGGATLRELLAAILEIPDLLVTRHLKNLNVDVCEMLSALKSLDENSNTAVENRVLDRMDIPLLNQFGRDLTELAAAGELGPVVGRRKEVLQVMQTLARRSKNNAILVGEAGVGKTAIAELLAIRIVEGRDGMVIKNYRVIEVTMSSLLAGAGVIGEREKRLEGIIAECKANPQIILFIDEIHTVMKAGGVSGSVDPADILKPALARGDLRCLGATTEEEYARFIEADAALERRFERIRVVEPSTSEAEEIVRGVRPAIESHHNVKISDETLLAAIELSSRFDTHHQLPDKALDLLDKAAARSQLPALSMFAESAGNEKISVSTKVVAQVLADKIGVPADLIESGIVDQSVDADELRSYLASHIVGQDAAIEQIVNRLHLARKRLRERSGPLAVFLFAGPTGVGKTEIAKRLAQHMFNDKAALIRLDMSEFMEEHSVAKLIGSPPGYVGHEEGGQLTSRLRANPYSIVLLDELEKAHPRVLDIFLQLFDEGRITDAKGRTTDARHSVFIATSNVALQAGSKTIGFNPSGPLLTNLKIDSGAFRPEFLNRIDEIVVFTAMQPHHVVDLVKTQVAELGQNLLDRYQLSLRVSSDVFSLLSDQGYSAKYGVRELQRVMQTALDAPLGKFMETLNLANTDEIVVGVDDKNLTFQVGKNNNPGT